MARIIWEKKYNIGIDIIDEQHRSLCFLFNRISQAMEEGRIETALKQVIPEMLNYAKYHFKTEEDFMRRANYPGILEHIKKHEIFNKKVKEISAKVVGEPGVVIAVQIVNLLWEWFLNHILEIDRDYIGALKPFEKKKEFANIGVIEKVAEHEEKLSELYRAYSSYLSNKDFWVDLAAEEVMHAYQVRNMVDHIRNAEIHVNKERFKTPAIEFSKKHIEDKIKLAQAEKADILQALTISLDIEKSLLEKRYYEIYEGDSIELKYSIEEMNKSIARHIEKVEEELYKYKSNNKEERSD